MFGEGPGGAVFGTNAGGAVFGGAGGGGGAGSGEITAAPFSCEASHAGPASAPGGITTSSVMRRPCRGAPRRDP